MLFTSFFLCLLAEPVNGVCDVLQQEIVTAFVGRFRQSLQRFFSGKSTFVEVVPTTDGSATDCANQNAIKQCTAFKKFLNNYIPDRL